MATEYKTLADTTIDERITPIEQQKNPSLARAVESDEDATGSEDGETALGLQRNIDSVAARDDVPEERKPGNEVVAETTTKGGSKFDHDGDGKVGGSKAKAS